MAGQRKVRVGEDVSEWPEDCRELALQVPPSWRERAKNKLGATMTDPVQAKSVLERYSASYARKALQMRTASQQRQRTTWATKRIAAMTDEEVDQILGGLVPTQAQ